MSMFVKKGEGGVKMAKILSTQFMDSPYTKSYDIIDNGIIFWISILRYDISDD